MISVENLDKRYMVGHRHDELGYNSFREAAARTGKNKVRKTLDMARGRQLVEGDQVEEFWALQGDYF